MTKLLKFIGKGILTIIEWVFILLIFVAFAIRTSPFQTFVAQKATDFLSKELKTEVKIDEVAIVFIDEIRLDGVMMKDLSGDTLFAGNQIFVTLKDLDLKTNHFEISEVDLQDGYAHIKKDTNGILNMKFLTDYFKSEKPKKKEKKSVRFNIDKVKLTNTTFRYDDFRKDSIPKGMDYAHLNVRNINMEISDISIIDSDITANIEHLSADEQSGFKLEDFKAKAKVGQKGIYIDDLNIKTNHSTILAKQLDMKMNDFSDFNHFVDSVMFDANLQLSHVSMKDIATFAPQLAGMDEDINFSGTVKQNVNNLQISDFELRYKEKTRIRGNFNLPDFKNIENVYFNETIDYFYVDLKELESLQLPKSAGSGKIQLNNKIDKFIFAEGNKLRLKGKLDDFKVSVNKVKTQLGTVQINNGIRLTKTRNKSYYFETGDTPNNLIVQNFNLGKFINNRQLGMVDGKIKLKGIAGSGKFELKDIYANVNRFDFNNYHYRNIKIKDGSFKNNIVDAKVDINDPNVELTFDGEIDLKDDLSFNFKSDISEASLKELGFMSETMNVCAQLDINLSGTNLDNLQGTGTLNDVSLLYKAQEINLPKGNINIQRGKEKDEFSFQSNLVDILIEGKVDFEHLANDLNYQFSQIVPSLYTENPNPNHDKQEYRFIYDINFKSINNVLHTFAPDISIAENSSISGEYLAGKSLFQMDINSDWVKIKKMELKNISIQDSIRNNKLFANFSIDQFKVNDSLYFDEITFGSKGQKNEFNSILKWDTSTDFASEIKWKTHIDGINKYLFNLNPSFFSVNQNRWEIANASKIQLDSNLVNIEKFKLKRNKQSIEVDGQISESDDHKLNYQVNNLEIQEITDIFMKNLAIDGQFNAWGYVSNPTKNIDYLTDGQVVGLNINDYDIGDIFIQSEWENATQSIMAKGSLNKLNSEMISFDGNFYPDRKENSINANITFNETDIDFANSIAPEKVVNEIKGALDGTVTISGEPNKPMLNGEIDLKNVSANLEVVDAAFRIDGKVDITKDAIAINRVPIFDEENNPGILSVSVFHDNFKDMSIDVTLNLEENALKKHPTIPYRQAPLDKFLVMNAQNEVGRSFYGKAYVTGNVNIFGETNNLEVTVDAKTERGTVANIPIFGTKVVSTEDDLIKWINTDETTQTNENEVDLTGINLDINLEATQDAQIRVVLDEAVGNVLEAKGDGILNLGVNQFGELTLNGAYTVDNGKYEFVLGPVRQKFFIDEGGTISWSGNPYDAQLDLSAYHIVNANIGELTPEVERAYSSHQPVYCYLDISNTLMSPEIKFNIKAPQANDDDKIQLTSVTSNEDELNRQFFSLLLWKSFQPLSGQTSVGTNAAIDLATNQINSLLAQMSPDYKLNVDINNDQITGENSFALGVKKEFLDNRLIVSGSFGVENQTNESQSSNSFIGDLNVEYLINEKGTFRVNAFNQSNDQSVIYNQQKGPFTQGIGLKYREDFNSSRDFRLIQGFLDLFRKNKYIKKKRKKHQVPLPPPNVSKEAKLD